MYFYWALGKVFIIQKHSFFDLVVRQGPDSVPQDLLAKEIGRAHV